MKATVRKLLLAGLAVASLTAFGGSTQASTNGQTAASETQSYCNIVPAFCKRHCTKGPPGAAALCDPV